MNVKRTLTFAALGAVLAALFSSAATTGRRPAVSPAVQKITPVETNGAELAAEIARLRDRLRPRTPPERPSRNLFEFHAAPQPRAIDVAPPPASDNVIILPTALPLRLVGVAEDEGPDGAVRTAIISGQGDLWLAKEGDEIARRYRVLHITADAVDLQDLNDGSLYPLQLR
jgi:hypothetical protein